MRFSFPKPASGDPLFRIQWDAHYRRGLITCQRLIRKCHEREPKVRVLQHSRRSYGHFNRRGDSARIERAQKSRRV